MKYLIVQDWINTSNNHAGMKYLACRLHELHPEQIMVYVVPDYEGMVIVNLKKGLLDSYISKVKNKINKLFIQLGIKENRKDTVIQQIKWELSQFMRPGDEVFLMEYLEPLSDFVSIAKWVKSQYPLCKVSCMVHLVPSKIDSYFSEQQVYQCLAPIDKVVTLGHSLSEYLINRGVASNKIVTSFHYVDNYYRNLALNDDLEKQRIRVLAMGNQMRNQKVLKAIIEANPTVEFTICQGCNDMRKDFQHFKNVELIPFVDEEQLREYMANSDISLNVMVDTIGSNVIVTSMAMGLAMVCSDVGSIRDYCDESNCIFCDNDNIQSFSRAIASLSSDRKKLMSFRRKSVEKSQLLTIERFYSQVFGDEHSF